MPHEDHENLSERERERFEQLPKEHDPSPSLETRVVRSLAERGLIGTASAIRSRRWSRFVLATAAALALVAMGYLGGRRLAEGPGLEGADGSLFVLLLYEGEETFPAEDSVVPEYVAWARGVRESHGGITGERLEEDGRVLRLSGGRLDVELHVKAGADGAIGGYFLIAARDYDEAVLIASGCPHLKYGGVIEVRRIAPV